MTDADRTDKAEERENMYIMMFTLQSLQNYGLSVKKTVERSLDYLWEWYQESGEERYLLLAKQHMQAYVNMGFALNEQNQTIRDIISILDQTIADFYPKDSLPGKRVKLTKAQIRSMIGRWRPSRENPMTIGELVEDIIKKDSPGIDWEDFLYAEDDKIIFSEIKEPVTEETRTVFLQWIAQANVSSRKTGRTEYGQEYRLIREQDHCVLKCEDGDLTMPSYVLEFKKS